MSNKGQLLQDPFLNALRREHVPVSIYLVNGIKLQGQVESFDQYVVLTFRNVHNWRFGGADNTANAFKQIFAMLKPGGTLGVVDHRLNESDDAAKEEKSGYMKESSIIAFAEAAGFKLAGKSEINANLKDTKDYEKGVWTLPPVLREGEVDRAKYVAIGESDRMTLKFVKPAS